jgi:signal transduction histidine kinase
VTLAAVAAFLATLAVPFVAPLQFAYRAPGLHVALETGAALAVLLAAVIVVRAWSSGPRLDRLAIATGLAVMACSSAVLTALLAVAPDSGPRGPIALSGMLVGSVLLAAGVFAPGRVPRNPKHAVRAMLLVTVLALGVVAVPIALALGDRPVPPPDIDLAEPRVQGPVTVLAVQVATVIALALAAIGLTRRGIRAHSAFARRLGLALIFILFAKVNYVLMPPVDSELLHAGDVLKLLFCLVLLWAAVSEVAEAVATRAAERERRRIARDLHDGVAQELAFIRRRAARMIGQPDADDIAGAAERALLDSRWAIEHLARPPDEPLDRVLSRHAGVIAARTGVAMTFTASGSADVEPEVREALARILGEAVANAGHGRATRVHVELSNEPLRLRVIDDGAGFDPAVDVPGFGLGGMRERAELVGAELRVRSGPGAGTEVAVELP